MKVLDIRNLSEDTSLEFKRLAKLQRFECPVINNKDAYSQIRTVSQELK